MQGYVGKEIVLLADLGSTQVDLDTVGYRILNGDLSEYSPRSVVGVVELGNGWYTKTLPNNFFADEFVGHYEFTPEVDSEIEAREELTVKFTPATPADVDVQVETDVAGLIATVNSIAEDLVQIADIVEAVKLKTDWLGTAQKVSVIGPMVSAGQIHLVNGDDYLDSDGRALSWQDTKAVWPNLAGKTVSFVVDNVLEKTVTVVDANTLKLELTAADTILFSTTHKEDFSLVVNFGTEEEPDVVTLQVGKITTIPKFVPPVVEP